MKTKAKPLYRIVRPRLSESEKGIIRRAFRRHRVALLRASDKCMGSMWPGIYAGEADRTDALLVKLLGPSEVAK